MNILLNSVGRRAYLVKYFKDVEGVNEVHVSNSDDLSVAFKYADKSVVSPLIYDKAYIPFLLDYCQENKIDILISLFDIDLPVLARNKEKFAQIGTRVIVSSPELTDMCNDKWKTYLYLKENGFNVPQTHLNLQSTLAAITKGELHYPIIVKPRFGCGSISMSVAEDEESLRYLADQTTRAVNRSYLKYESAGEEDKIIFQECLQGQEYGADVINDLDGRFVNTVIKKKVAMRAGETDIAELCDQHEIVATAKKLGNLTGHIANLDCDLFLVDGKAYVLELNARFGGGYPFSHMGGCNLPRAIVSWCRGETVEKSLLTAKTGIRGFKELYITEY